MKQPDPLCLIRILRHRSEIVFGVLEITLRRDPVSRQSFGAGQDQIALIIFLRALSVACLGAGEPGRFISAGRLGSSRRCAGHNFRIWAWLCRRVFRFRNVFHVGPYSAPAEAVRRSFEKLSCCSTVDAAKDSDQSSGVREVGHGTRLETQRPAERIHFDCVSYMRATGDFKLTAAVPGQSQELKGNERAEKTIGPTRRVGANK